jgi:hypothetical protein
MSCWMCSYKYGSGFWVVVELFQLHRMQMPGSYLQTVRNMRHTWAPLLLTRWSHCFRTSTLKLEYRNVAKISSTAQKPATLSCFMVMPFHRIHDLGRERVARPLFMLTACGFLMDTVQSRSVAVHSTSSASSRSSKKSWTRRVYCLDMDVVWHFLYLEWRVP